MMMEDMTTVQVTEGLKRTRTVVFPFGSVEEHGSHLPLSTDQITAYEISRAASKLIPFFVTPQLWYGVCRSTSQHPGTITISGSTLRLLAQDIAVSLYEHGFRSFILFSGHAGSAHIPVLREAGEWMLAHLPECKVAALSIIELINKDFLSLIETPGDLHAGEVETSLIMHLRPDLVGDELPGAEFPSFPNPILVREKRKLWPGGVWGDPSKANAAKGERMFTLLVDGMVDLVRRVEQFQE